MADLAENVISPIESAFATIGLVSPVSRAIFGIGVGFLFWYAVRPASSVGADKRTPLPFKPLAAEDVPSTWFPWWMYPLGLGLLFGVFI